MSARCKVPDPRQPDESDAQEPDGTDTTATDTTATDAAAAGSALLEPWPRMQARLGHMAASLLGLVEEIRDFGNTPGSLFDSASGHPAITGAGAEEAEDLLVGELACVVLDRLLPAYRDCYELYSRPPGAERGCQPDIEALWKRLRPERLPPAS